MKHTETKNKDNKTKKQGIHHHQIPKILNKKSCIRNRRMMATIIKPHDYTELTRTNSKKYNLC